MAVSHSITIELRGIGVRVRVGGMLVFEPAQLGAQRVVKDVSLWVAPGANTLEVEADVAAARDPWSYSWTLSRQVGAGTRPEVVLTSEGVPAGPTGISAASFDAHGVIDPRSDGNLDADDPQTRAAIANLISGLHAALSAARADDVVALMDHKFDEGARIVGKDRARLEAQQRLLVRILADPDTTLAPLVPDDWVLRSVVGGRFIDVRRPDGLPPIVASVQGSLLVRMPTTVAPIDGTWTLVR